MNTTYGDYTLLYYTKESIFNQVVLESLYFAKSITDVKPDSTDDLAISEVERSMFDMLLDKAYKEVYMKLSRMGQGVTDAIQFEEAIDNASTSTIDETTSLIYYLSLPTYWDDNMTSLLDEKVLECIKMYIHKEWFKSLGLVEVRRDKEEELEKLYKDLKSIMFYRTKRPTLKYNDGFR